MKFYIGEKNEANRYGSEQLIRPRIGQGTFKVMVTEAASMQEAREWFKQQADKSGAKFIPVEILHLEDENKLCHVYYFVHDIENYESGMKRMQETEVLGSGAMEFMSSFTRVEIDEDGDIHIVY